MYTDLKIFERNYRLFRPISEKNCNHFQNCSELLNNESIYQLITSLIVVKH